MLVAQDIWTICFHNFLILANSSFYMNEPSKGTDCLQKSFDGIFILSDKVELSADLFTAVTGETAIFLMFQKHLLLAENECAFLIIQSAVFVQTNLKILP